LKDRQAHTQDRQMRSGWFVVSWSRQCCAWTMRTVKPNLPTWETSAFVQDTIAVRARRYGEICRKAEVRIERLHCARSE